MLNAALILRRTLKLRDSTWPEKRFKVSTWRRNWAHKFQCFFDFAHFAPRRNGRIVCYDVVWHEFAVSKPVLPNCFSKIKLSATKQFRSCQKNCNSLTNRSVYQVPTKVRQGYMAVFTDEFLSICGDDKVKAYTVKLQEVKKNWKNLIFCRCFSCDLRRSLQAHAEETKFKNWATQKRFTSV